MLAKLLKPKNTSWATKKKSPPTMAAAAVMLKLAQADGHKSDNEMKQLRAMLHKEFQLQDQDIDSLLASAAISHASAQDLNSLAKEIRSSWGNARRIQLLEYLWVLAYADDRIDPKETDLIERVAGLLYLTEAEQYRAQEGAEKRFGLGGF